ncbi:MAG: glycosyltransferase family 4 protein [Steroidobacteraceae bacterium]
MRSDADVKRLYQRAACLLLPARALPGRIEGFGLVIVEAGAQGCPTVATKVGGIPEALGEGGTLVDIDDVEQSARAIAAYVHDPEKRRRDGAAARSNAATFTWAACARKTFPDLAWPTEGVAKERFSLSSAAMAGES